MLTPEFPEWVPRAVAEAALYLLNNPDPDAPPVDPELVLRLARHADMQAVWHTLGKLAPRPPAVSWDDAVGVVFTQACFVAEFKPSALPVTELDALRESYERLAAETRDLLRRMREVVATVPIAAMWDPGFPEGGQDYASRLEEVAAYWDRVAAYLSDMRGGSSPFVVGRDYHGSAEARGFVRALARDTRRLFARPLYDALATVTNVALRPRVSVTKQRVRDWTRDIHRGVN